MYDPSSSILGTVHKQKTTRLVLTQRGGHRKHKHERRLPHLAWRTRAKGHIHWPRRHSQPNQPPPKLNSHPSICIQGAADGYLGQRPRVRTKGRSEIPGKRPGTPQGRTRRNPAHPRKPSMGEPAGCSSIISPKPFQVYGPGNLSTNQPTTHSNGCVTILRRTIGAFLLHPPHLLPHLRVQQPVYP